MKILPLDIGEHKTATPNYGRLRVRPMVRFWMLRGKLTSRRPHTAMSERWTGAQGICQRICKAHVFDETFGVNSAFNAEIFIAAPHPVAMEFDLFGGEAS